MDRSQVAAAAHCNALQLRATACVGECCVLKHVSIMLYQPRVAHHICASVVHKKHHTPEWRWAWLCTPHFILACLNSSTDSRPMLSCLQRSSCSWPSASVTALLASTALTLPASNRHYSLLCQALSLALVVLARRAERSLCPCEGAHLSGSQQLWVALQNSSLQKRQSDRRAMDAC